MWQRGEFKPAGTNKKCNQVGQRAAIRVNMSTREARLFVDDEEQPGIFPDIPSPLCLGISTHDPHSHIEVLHLARTDLVSPSQGSQTLSRPAQIRSAQVPRPKLKPSRSIGSPIHHQPQRPHCPQLQPFRVKFTFDPTGYEGAVGVREGEEVWVSEEREGGWSVVCWLDGTERGIVPTPFIELLNKPLTPSHDTLLQPPHNSSLLSPNTLLPTPAQQPVPYYHQHQVPSVTNSSTQQPAYSPQFVDTPKWHVRQTLRAIEDYSAPPEHPNCLSLRTGQVVTLLEFTEPWCRIRENVTNQEGFVPTRSLEALVLPTTHPSYQQPQTWPPPQPIPQQPQLASTAVDVAAAPPPTKEEAKPICALTGKVIVKRAHLRNEPDVFYGYV
ncbi:hypothetical protein BLNAU_15679 [Blattamonas nauphoetae]|uniref:SH3 domain-containing protein n=1 Tax=Blattamonas nauphoetae TaxID=2049346 RepID=A0ABQ9XDM6_9EUKA|nr:hypothetical protein BLNAU_15679 [Blattamonas nauphoetae]